jgi:hypothetical protein
VLHVLQFGDDGGEPRPRKLYDLLNQLGRDLAEVRKRLGTCQEMNSAVVLDKRLIEHGAVELLRLFGQRKQCVPRLEFQQRRKTAAAKT